MTVSRTTFQIVTNGSGAFVDTGPPIDGRVTQIRYVKDGTTPLDTGADFTLELAQSGVRIAAETNFGLASITRYPHPRRHTDTGAQDTGGVQVVAKGESLRLTIAAGGASKVGTFYVWTSDP